VGPRPLIPTRSKPKDGEAMSRASMVLSVLGAIDAIDGCLVIISTVPLSTSQEVSFKEALAKVVQAAPQQEI